MFCFGSGGSGVISLRQPVSLVIACKYGRRNHHVGIFNGVEFMSVRTS